MTTLSGINHLEEGLNSPSSRSSRQRTSSRKVVKSSVNHLNNTTNSETQSVNSSSRSAARTIKNSKSTLFTLTGESLKAKINSNRPNTLLISSEKAIQKELEEINVDKEIQKNVGAFKKNKQFLSLTQTWKYKVLEIASSLTDFVPSDENRMEIKKTLSSKIKDLRMEVLPLKKRKYSY